MTLTIITIVAAWLASGLVGSALTLLMSGGIDALTGTRPSSFNDDRMWALAILGPIALLLAIGDVLSWLMPRIMRCIWRYR